MSGQPANSDIKLQLTQNRVECLAGPKKITISYNKQGTDSSAGQLAGCYSQLQLAHNSAGLSSDIVQCWVS